MAFIPQDAIWYIADIVEEIRVSGYKSSSLHINTVLIRASSPEEAYKKAILIGKTYNHSYQNVYDQTVQCKFRGLRDLNVIHDELTHGAELTYTRRERLSPKRIKSFITKKNDLAVFSDIKPLSGANIMPKTITQKLQKQIQG